MSLTVRGLLPKVMPFRKDFEQERAIFSIQEAVRKVCRQTMLAQENLTNIVAPSATVTLSPSSGNSLNRVHKVEIMDYFGNWRVMNEYSQEHIDNVYNYPDLPAGIPAGYTYLGNSQIHLYPSPEAVTLNYIVVGKTYSILTLGNTNWTGSGATSVTAGAFVVGENYIITSIGTTDFTLIGASANTIGVLFAATGVGTGTGTALKRLFTATSIPSNASGAGTVTQMLRATVSLIPTGEIDTIPLPDEAEDCIVAGAIATLLAFPGPGQNLQYSKDREVLHNRELGNLKAIALFGQSGRLRAVGRVLGGRQMVVFDARRTF